MPDHLHAVRRARHLRRDLGQDLAALLVELGRARGEQDLVGHAQADAIRELLDLHLAAVELRLQVGDEVVVGALQLRDVVLALRQQLRELLLRGAQLGRALLVHVDPLLERVLLGGECVALGDHRLVAATRHARQRSAGDTCQNGCQTRDRSSTRSVTEPNHWIPLC